MDLNSVGQKNIEDIATESLWLKATGQEKKKDSLIEELLQSSDTASSNALEKLKLQSLEAQEPGRAAYLEKIKAAVANGSFDVPADKLADALIDDGFIDFLID